ncbi:CheY-like superfamily [Aspergillus coremiiformis]|uniref:CheY-like superfamily n=1 Tax=Aspergillus coremiiformis TaxID=138285 RepID=A0A5N6ZFH5_9EURO|nr:CheY-like superfamily [Aspergillus coremiiformis]
MSSRPDASSRPTRSMTFPTDKQSKTNLHILVAEDDPTNSTILRKRLEMSGHTVYLTRDGKECASVYREMAHCFDAVLMDLQMPVVDGLTATKMIRESEQSSARGEALKHRVPILVVSSSSTEKDRQIYIDSGFDGWVMKPVGFHRIGDLLDGVYENERRSNYIYRPGRWDEGGWFEA